MINKEKTKEIINFFLKQLTVEFEEIEIIENNTHPIVFIKTKDSGLLIGNNGEGLRALNHIIKKIITKRLPEDNSKFLLDINGYHSQKIETLKTKALMLAERAKTFKSDIEMSPINAYERMIVHSMFPDDNQIKTVSEGEGKTRRIIFKYKN